MKSFTERCKEQAALRDGPRPIIDPIEFKKQRKQESIGIQRIEHADINALNAQIKRDNCPF